MSEAPAGTTSGVHTGLRKHPGFESAFLSDPRDLVVYVPPGYDDEPNRRYPVLYLHDGQNLFEGATKSPSLCDGDRSALSSHPPEGRMAFVPGQDWKVNDTAEALIARGLVEPLIIVGDYNTGRHSID